jgi:glycoside/pentoside/hexuronide:cation symporter, GPH family
VMLFGSVGIAFLLVAPLSLRLGKRRGAMLAGAVSLGLTGALYAAWLLRLYPGAPGAPAVLPMFAVVLLANAFAVVMMMLISSMMADVVEASQSETGRRSEGLFFAGYFFMQKCATGIGIFAAGLILSFAGFPDSAMAGQVAVAVLDRLGLYFIGTLIVVGGIGIAVLQRFPIERGDHQRRVANLAARRLAALDAAARTDPDATGAHP